MLNKSNPKETREWEILQDHFEEMKSARMKDLFASDPQRFSNLSTRFQDILVDYSKNIITDKTLELLIDLADKTDLNTAIDAFFKGEKDQ